ncbi:hypothetical protein BURPS305_4455 [Burkholderia pseudomallei 305]|nr:hypothetical protein BURPS305_4455 [Burkholderia pseudomallei 305]EEC37331.1 conserved hypothetical protein [Burkholderia pseudomallei 576]
MSGRRGCSAGDAATRRRSRSNGRAVSRRAVDVERRSRIQAPAPH